MFKFLEYFGRAQAFRGRLGKWPGWARGLMLLAAIPGAILLGLSIAAVLVSLAALLLLTVPLYRVLSGVLDRPGRQVNEEPTPMPQPMSGPEAVSPGQINPATGRRHIEVTIIE